MAKTYSINRTCDRCGAVMKSEQLELGMEGDPKERNQDDAPIISIRYGDVEYSYTDVCSRCARTLARIVRDARPISRSHSQQEHVETGEGKDTTGGNDGSQEGNGKGKRGKGGKRPPSRPGVPS